MKDKPVILVVDDEPQNIELLEAHLVPQGYEIVKAANGEEALGKLSDTQIDLILLDVKMPDMDGFEVTRRVRQDNTHRLLPIILVTVLRETQDRVRGIEAGCDDFISYPVDKMELLARVRSLLKVKAYNDLMSNYRKELESEVTGRTEELKHALENLQQDITKRKQAEEALSKSEKELKSKTENLEEVNAALNVLLKRVEEGRIELEEKISSNIRELVLPYIDRLKKTQLSDHQASYVMVIETNLDNIASSFLYHLKMRYLNLTHRELQVASLVKEGKSTKEIAGLLNIAIKTVVFHRNSLRNKLGLKNQKANLRAHLLTFT
jgi:DNA-binding response OmpR family regulator/DNA-binding CsgD family transcriptional regulator